MIGRPLPDAIQIRPARASDALCLGVLATQVFLDTYATQGIKPSIANEVLRAFSTPAMAALLARPDTTRVWVAEQDGHLIGFAQATLGTPQALAPAGHQAELDRLYVQEPFTGQGLGRALLQTAEQAMAQQGATVMWLTPWVHNHRALAFYARQGYADHGHVIFEMDGELVDNRVLATALS
jgi:ribosomal protein S18 acetylase RimI-like enzyme